VGLNVPKHLTKVWRVVRIPVLVYLGVCLVLWRLENSMVFQPTTAKQGWEPAPIPEIEDVELTSGDGTRIHAWFCPHPTATHAVLYCHGNAGNLSHRGGSIIKLRDILQASVLIFDYPGYGKSGGRPTEKGCYLAAEAAYDWLTTAKRFAGRNVLLYGGSLGGAVAMDLAARKPCRAVVLVKAFTSAPDVGAGMFPWLPVRWLMRNRFDNLAKLGACQVPVFIVHGDADSVVPYAHSLRLFEAANEPKGFLSLPGHDHNDFLPADFFVALNAFLDKHCK
jgi:fermentation-respiration switch protein FrsA (DUF1100 family)